MRTIFSLALMPLILLTVSGSVLAGQPAFDVSKRAEWNGSNVHGTPNPPDPYVLERVFPKLKFSAPTDIEELPGTNRFCVCTAEAKIYSFERRADVEKADIFFDIWQKDGRTDWEQHRFYGMTFHPDFAKNHYAYASYTDAVPRPFRIRISRFEVDMKANPPVIDPKSELILFEWVSMVDHHGGCLRFGRDGMLYCSAGDGAAYADGHLSGQDISDINASVIRIDVDHAKPGRTYAIPADNPFVNIPGARGEVWAYGLRNVWKYSFDRQTGDLWGCDVGQDLWDPVVLVEKGGNYGWSVTEGTHPFRPERTRGPTPILPPVYDHDHSEARSLTGGFVYRGKKLPDLFGSFVYGDWATGKCWALQYDTKAKKIIRHREIYYGPEHPVAFCEDSDAELYMLEYSGGGIYQFKPEPEEKPRGPFPKLLSQTGLFASTKDHLPAAGVIPYNVNSPLWSDHAHKERFIALPGSAKIGYKHQGGWDFPEGTVLVKSFMMDMDAASPTTRKRLETRLLHYENTHWRNYTYIWNDAQDDAVLLDEPAGVNRELAVKDASYPNGERKQVWHFPGRSECTLCHTMPPNFTLGTNTAQLNREFDYGNGVSANQLEVFNRLGLFNRPLEKYYADELAANAKREESKRLQLNWQPGQPLADLLKALPKLADPLDTAAPLDNRARAYLHANCAHCHVQWGGGNALFQFVYWLPLDQTAALDMPVYHGNFGIENPRIIAPGSPQRSMILNRMKSLGPERMPRLASSVIDRNAVKMIEEWLKSLPPPK